MSNNQLGEYTINSLLNKYGPWALVTGASSGIGEEFCRQLATHKFNLVMVARRKDRLDTLQTNLITNYSIQVKVIAIDLASDNFIDILKQATANIEIGLLINNAGYALSGDFLTHKIEDELNMLYVNCRAPLILTQWFGNKMLSRGYGGIINVSSITAFIAMPKRTSYSASKAHSLYFSEGLWFELKNQGIDVLALCPGATKTEFGQVSGTKNYGASPKSVVDVALNSLGKQVMALPGYNNKIVAFLTRFISRQMLIKLGAKIMHHLTIIKD